jgi:hypothetical protein
MVKVEHVQCGVLDLVVVVDMATAAVIVWAMTFVDVIMVVLLFPNLIFQHEGYDSSLF